MPTVGSVSCGCCPHVSTNHIVEDFDGHLGIRKSLKYLRSLPGHPSICGFRGLTSLEVGSGIRQQLIKCVVNEGQKLTQDEEEEEEDELCPVECVREFYTDEEFSNILEKANKTNALVVVDFYRTSCGSCKYIEQGFSKICKAFGDDDVPIIFLKHNVLDEYDEQSEVAERLRIKTVPLFHFYKNGILLEAFPTRDKERITDAIERYSSPGSLPEGGLN